MVKWIEMQNSRFTHCTATLGVYVLSIVGSGSGWVWTIRQQDCVDFQGLEKSLADAKHTTETVALRMQGGEA